MKVLMPALIAALMVPQGKLLYRSSKGDFLLTDFSSGNAEFDLEKHETSFSGAGLPAHLSAPDRGFDVLARSLSGRVRQDSGQPAVVLKLDAQGDVIVSFDSKFADAYLASQGQTPPQRKEASSAQFKSQRVAYEGSETIGTATFPDPFEIESASAGERPVAAKGNAPATSEAFAQTLCASARQGVVVIDPRAKDKAADLLRTGKLEGGVQIHLVRTVKRKNEPKPSLTDLQATAERANFDFTSTDRKVELIGHVVITNVGEFSGTLEADMATVYLDQNLKVTRISTVGSPIRSKFSQPDTGGGR